MASIELLLQPVEDATEPVVIVLAVERVLPYPYRRKQEDLACMVVSV
jgi:hypothetical protein